MPEGKILVVDDEERQREIYRDILQGEGYEAETAASGEAALKMLEHSPLRPGHHRPQHGGHDRPPVAQ